MNVSKAIKKLRNESLALITSGGNNGKRLEKILLKEDINFRAMRVKNETHENFIVLSDLPIAHCRFALPGGELLEAEVKELLPELKELQPDRHFGRQRKPDKLR